MIESKYISGKELPKYDPEITSAINAYAIDGGGNTMVIGVKNHEGQIYRVIDATGMGAYITITSALTKIGLEDELKNSLYGENGFDSIFKSLEK